VSDASAADPATPSATSELDVVLAPLMEPVAALRGVGTRKAALIARATGGTRVIDVLFHLPERFIDRSDCPSIAAAVQGEIATLTVDVVTHRRPDPGSKQPWRVQVTDGTGFADLAFFHNHQARSYPPGLKIVVSGKVERFRDTLTITHPKYIQPADSAAVPAIEPVWPLVADLRPGDFRAVAVQALAKIPPLPEWHEPKLMQRERWPGFADALRAMHAPSEHPTAGTRARLAYDELLAHQIALSWRRTHERARAGRPLTGDGDLRRQALTRFGHQLTPSQTTVLAEIDADLAAPNRMLRLLQGDVGSGKTLVAIMAMLRAVEAGAQAAMMAPTETLARQHHRTLTRISPTPVALLTGSVKGVARRNTLLGLQSGRIPLVVGTHALFQDGVAYRDLALAVIDEQHRFGVDQRLSLGSKGDSTDVLVMTATPIPRTLLLTQWGEMAVSRLAEKPAGRQAIRTSLHSMTTIGDVSDALARALGRGDQVFWVCPMVTENELLDVAAAEARYRTLRLRFGDLVGLAHGQLDTDTRERALARFAAGETRVLVATTVIEVGVDVPAASVMVVEQAERFGLAQLHQLRGRVGRGAAASYCLLLHDDALNEAARRRLVLLRDTEDGFVIADEDFRIRGGGDVLGRRQSGQPGWRLADPVEHDGLLQMAYRDAAHLLERDPKLTSERGRSIRLLLRMFERGAALRTLASG
jgi:ATP-dependent DNA helicase RecG